MCETCIAIFLPCAILANLQGVYYQLIGITTRQSTSLPFMVNELTFILSQKHNILRDGRISYIKHCFSFFNF